LSEINLDGSVAEEIYRRAISVMPDGADVISKMIAGRGRHTQSRRQIFVKTLKSMSGTATQNKEDIIKRATADYLRECFPFPGMNAPDFDVKSCGSRITLTYEPVFSNDDEPERAVECFSEGNVEKEGGVQSNPEEDICETRHEPIVENAKPGTEDQYVYETLSNEEIIGRLKENGRWLEQKRAGAPDIARLFSAGTGSLEKAFKGGVPQRADFAGCEITGFDFSAYDLSGADFKGARLADCTITKMEGACLSGAEIVNCKFDCGVLAASDFSGAVITGTSFDGADLRGCNFNKSQPRNVSLKNAVFKDTNLDFSQPKNIIFETGADTSAAAEKHAGTRKAVNSKTARVKKAAKAIAAGSPPSEKTGGENKQSSKTFKPKKGAIPK
jgi:hypothetical protein